MGDSRQDSKKRTTYEPWTKEETDLLLELMVDGARRGWRGNSGIFSKATVEERILNVFNERLRCNRTYSNYQSRLKWFKSRWIAYSNLLKYSSGFGYDHNTKKFTAMDEVWDAYLASHLKDTHLPYGECPDYEDLRIAVGNGVAIERNSIRLGIATDANTLGEDENRNVRIEDLTFDPENDAFVALSQDDQPPSSFTPPSGQPEVTKSSTQRPKQAKRSRTQYEATSGSSEKIMEERRPITRIGYHFVKDMIEGDPQRFRQLYRMYPDAFLKLCSIITDKTPLQDTRHICVEEMVATFLIIVRHNDRYCNVRQRFSRSHFSTSQNFNKFMYVLSGWEGSAHDSKLLSDALSRTNGLQVPQGKYFLVDCGFANRRQFLAHLRGVRYHLKDFGGEGRHPRNASELFNLRHASLRNMIERIFGVFKSRFTIFKTAPPFSFQIQAELVLACAGLHNFL
ncbi:nuclease HARBI1-like protein [Perilla frutescens var. frutescens]|nr:nuclease HARBI1-like protein [Perilla frutescens var. frutescens]